MEGLERIVAEHPFFAGLGDAFTALVSGCVKNVRFEAGQDLFHEGDPANEFYLVRHGQVALQLTAPGRGTVTFLTVGPGEPVGVSWLIPPYKWTFDAEAQELVRAIAIDAAGNAYITGQTWAVNGGLDM